MANLMRDWIAPTANDEFFNAFESLKSEYTPGQILQKYPYDCSPDDVTVHMTKGRHVQLIDFNGKYEYPFEVTLSDATTKIRATFTPNCTAEFGSDQEFVQRTLGAILGITGYYLTYNPKSPPSQKLTLRITNFKALGCEGNPAFGRPVNIEDQESLCDTMAKLDNLLSGSETNSRYDAEEELEILSQGGDQEERESSPIINMTTQRSDFATQVPAGKAEGHILSAGGITKTSSINKGADFMALLKVPQGKDAGSAGRGGMPRTTVNVQAVSILQPVSGSRRAEMTSKLGSKANSQSLATSSSLKDCALPPKESDLPHPSHSIPGDDSEKENSQESLKKQKVWIPVENLEKIRPVVEAEESETLRLYTAQIPEGSTFDGMKRVPRSYVRIPENQKALLESKESWWKPDNGSRLSYANIPPEVLRDLDAHADQVHSGEKSLDALGKIDPEDLGSDGDTDEENDEDQDDDDDNADDEESDKVHCEGPSHLPSEILEDSINDEESVFSWPETHYSDAEPDRLEAAVGSSLEAVVESTHDNSFKMATDLLSAQKSAHPSPPVSKKAIPAKLKPNFDYSFPSSSPGDEEELEIVVPHAIDDELDENDAETIEEKSKTSQDLPSTVVTYPPVIQVEQSPDHNVGNGKQTDLICRTRPFGDRSKANGTIPSDPIIPATFHDPSSQDHPPTSKKGHPAVSDKRTHVGFFSSEQLYTLQEDNLAPEDHDVIEEEEDMDQEKFFTEVESSQHKRSEQTAPFSPKNRTPQHGAPSLRPASYNEDKMVRVCSSPHGSPQPPASSSFHTAFSEMRPESEKLQQIESSPINADSPKRASEDSQPKGRRFKNRPFVLSLAATALASQGDGIARDSAAMRRAQRHEFYARHSSPFEEPPVVQIAQSQPKSPNSKQVPSAKPSTETVSSQPSNDFVRSSIPEQVKKPDQQRITDALPTKSHTARERSPFNEGSQPAEASQMIASTGSRSLSAMESLELKSDLGIAPTAPENSDFRAECRSSKIDENERDFPSEKNLEMVSNSSNSEDEGLLDVRELADDNDLADKQAMGEEDRHVGEEELVHDQKLPKERHLFTKATAFDKFRSIYPSYSGSERKFVWALAYIEWLIETKGEDFLRPSLWDDLVRTLAAEYLEYMREARHSGEKIRTGFEYFNRIDKPPLFQQRFLTPATLQNYISTLDPQQVKTVRLMFKKSTFSSTGPPRPESSHGTPSITSKNSQSETKGKDVVAGSVIEITEHLDTVAILEARSLKRTERTLTKRPFFETPSQLQAAKKPRTSTTGMQQDLGLDVLRSPKSRRSLPLAQADSPRSSHSQGPSSRDRLTISASTSASHTSPENPKLKQQAASSKPFNGSPASPILGEPEPASRSFSPKNIRTSSITFSPAPKGLFKKLSAPVSRTALQQQGKLSTSNTGKVEGWLDSTEVDDGKEADRTITTPRLHQKESIKRKRDGELELLNTSTLASKTGNASSAKRAKARPQLEGIASTPPMPMLPSFTSRTRTGTIGAEVRTTSFKDFLKRRASGLTSKSSARDLTSSTRRTKSAERTAGQHMEPETQAWDGF